MADLWGALEETPVPEEKPVQTIVIATPNEVVTQDLVNNGKIQSETEQLRTSMNCSALIVVAAYKVADYVPNLQKDDHREFWQTQVIPALVKSLDQDVKARAVMQDSFTSIRNLAIVIQRGAELVKMSKGSKVSVIAAQRTINGALEDLKKSIVEAEAVSSLPIEEFAARTSELLQVMGPEAANFTRQKAEIEDQIRLQRDKERQLYVEIAKKKGEMEHCSNLIHVTENRAKGSAAALQDTKRRIQEMNALNAQVETTIQKIPATLTETKTTTRTHGGFFFPWRKTTHTSTDTKPIENPNREVEKNYYESLLLSRVARIRQNTEEEGATEKVSKDLEECLSENKGKYAALLEELKHCEASLAGQVAEIQREIDSLNAKLVNIDKNEDDAATNIGHHGNTLIQCLTEIRILAKAINNGATAYKPLVGVLKAVQSSVDAQIEMLNSPDPNDIFLGGNQLLRQVECIGHYHTSAVDCLKPPQEYLETTTRVKMLALELSTKPKHDDNA